MPSVQPTLNFEEQINVAQIMQPLLPMNPTMQFMNPTMQQMNPAMQQMNPAMQTQPTYNLPFYMAASQVSYNNDF